MDTITRWVLLACLGLCVAFTLAGFWLARRVGTRQTGLLVFIGALGVVIALVLIPAPTHRAFAATQFGALRAQGLYAVEQVGGEQFVWTRGKPTFTFETVVRKPVTLTITLRSATVTNGPDSMVRVLANGVLIGTAHPEPGNTTAQSFSFTFVPPLTERSYLFVEMEVPTFVPSANDPRTLGVMMTGISLDTGGAWASVTDRRWLLWLIVGLCGLAAGLSWLARRRSSALAGFGAIVLCGIAGCCALLLMALAVRVGVIDRHFYSAWLLGCMSLGLCSLAATVCLPWGRANAPSIATRLTEWWARRTPEQRRWAGWVGSGAILALAAVPVLHIASIIATTGENNLSEDFGDYIPVAARIIDGGYAWSHYFRDTFSHGQSYAFPFIIDVLASPWTHWNVYLVLGVGFGLSLARLTLLQDALTVGTKNSTAHWLLWPLLAALIFSTSQINHFTAAVYGDNGISVPLVLFGLTLGIWALVRFPHDWRGVTLMVLGGAVATLSGGLGPLTWPVFLLGLVLLGVRTIMPYIVWLMAAIITTLPYIAFLVIARPASSSSLAIDPGTAINVRFVLQAVGYPLTEHFSLHAAEIVGAIGIAFGISGLLALWQLRQTAALRQSVPALLLIAFGVLHIAQLIVFRGELFPWYAGGLMVYWIGLLGLAYVLWISPHPLPSPASGGGVTRWRIRASRTRVPLSRLRGKRLGAPYVGAAPLWSLAFISALAPIYLTSNLTYEDKVNQLNTRSPVSAACLRHYRIAPPYCVPFVSPLGAPATATALDRFGQSLEQHDLSVFAPHQRWTLQGDFIFDTVRLHQAPGTPDIRWTTDQSPFPTAWSAYQHLNLLLYAPNSIAWTVALPANLIDAEFHSAIALSTVATVASGADGVTFHLFLERDGAEKMPLFSRHLAAGEHRWQPFTVPLSAYAGQTITLELTADGGANSTQDWAMYRYPYIDLHVDPKTPAPLEVRDPRFVPQPTAADLIFNLSDGKAWTAMSVQRVPNTSDTWVVGRDPTFFSKQPLTVCLADYSHLSLRLAASATIYPRTLRVFYGLDGNDPTTSIAIPLYPDDELHDYTFDLKLLGGGLTTHLTSLNLRPVAKGTGKDDSRVQIADFRLIRRPGPSACGAVP